MSGALGQFGFDVAKEVKGLDWGQGIEVELAEIGCDLLGGVDEELQLLGVVFLAAAFGPLGAADVMDGQFGKQLAGALQNGLGDASEPRDMDAVGPVGSTFDDAVQEDDLVFPFADGDVEIAHAFEALGEFGKLVIVRGE